MRPRITPITLIAALAVFFIGAASSGAAPDPSAPGSLDATFSGDGKARISFGEKVFATAQDVLVYHGRTLTAGYVATGEGLSASSRFALTRQLWNGDRDRTFGGDGRVTTGLAEPSQATRLARYGRWKVVVAGTSSAPRSSQIRFALARYRWDGRLDPSFGDNGTVRTVVADGDTFVSDVLVQDNGKIVAAGATESGQDFENGLVVVRYLRDGTLDETFGDGGIVTAEVPVYEGEGPGDPRRPWFSAVKLLRDGRFVAAGSVELGCCRERLVVARFRRDGSLDDSFAGDGHVETRRFDEERLLVTGIALDPNGKIIVGASAGEEEGNEFSFSIYRYKRGGMLDKSFGNNGLLRTTPKGWAYSYLEAIAIQPNGKIVATGSTSRERSAGRYQWFLRVDRYTRAGALDKSFGGDGIVRTNLRPHKEFPISPPSQSAVAATLRPRGRITAAGYVTTNLESRQPRAAIAIVRYER
jgi:uncharacterized delta-60 repeat protein